VKNAIAIADGERKEAIEKHEYQLFGDQKSDTPPLS